ncbi:MAG: LamG-like jellyroll fold domain-containing protein [Chloroflexota bacterium]
MAIRATAALLAIAGLLGLAATSAGAEVVPRLADLESNTTAPFDFDQVSKHCATSSASRETGLAYSGSASLKVHTQNSECSGPYARGIFQANSSRHLVEGNDFWVGMAIYLPSGFYAAHTGYTDLMRIDSYVYDDGKRVPYSERAEINFASWSNDSIYVRAARGGTARTLIGPISPSLLPEGKWSWVELHVKLSAIDGSAYTELKVNGVSVGSSKTANLFAGAAPLNRIRYGIVSTDSAGSGNLTLYVDRASLSPGERGPLSSPSTPPPNEEPAGTESSLPPGIAGLWRLDETAGTTASDATGSSPGVYVNGPTLGVPGIDSNGFGTAASFDGIDDYVAIEPTPSLDVSKALTIEAWCDAREFRGAVVQRYKAYELRVQPNGNLILKAWIDGTLQVLKGGAGAVSPGVPHYIVGTYDGTTMRLYIDGAEVKSQPMSGQMTPDEKYSLSIARNDRESTYFDGVLDDVAIYSTALSPSTVLEHFRRGILFGQP